MEFKESQAVINAQTKVKSNQWRKTIPLIVDEQKFWVLLRKETRELEGEHEECERSFK